MKHTDSLSGIVNFSRPTANMPSSSPFEALLPWTIKYFGCLRSNAASLPGSRVSVAENKSFWHEGSFLSVIEQGMSGMENVWRNAGATASEHSEVFLGFTRFPCWDKSQPERGWTGGLVAAST